MSKLDDSFMYSGMTSASTEPKTPRQIQKEEKEKDYYKLKPAAEVVLELINKERDAVTDVRTIILDRTTTSEEINTELLARKLYLSHLNTLESKVKNILKLGATK